MRPAPRRIVLTAVCGPMLVLLGISIHLYWTARGAQAQEATRAPVDLTTAITRIARQNIPAVVHIEVTERQEIANPLLPFENDPLLRKYFNLPKKLPKKLQREIVGLGTGMIIDPQGHILTNNHVVGGATRIRVTLASGRVFANDSVEAIGSDAKTDLAVIRIKTDEQLPFVKFGDSDKVEVGQWVVAIGHPRGLNQSVTQGIISAMHRSGIEDPSSYEDFLQTDAAINPGNSGGPLLNLDGEVVGINAVISSQSGGFEGIGFAIPSNMGARIARELIEHGKIVRGWIGVTIQDLTPELAQSIGQPDLKGVLIADVTKGGPADQAGIKNGDVITAFQGKPVSDSVAFRNDAAITPVGQEVKVTLLRSGTSMEVTVKVEDQEVQMRILDRTVKERLGGAVRALTAAETTQMGLESLTGLIIVSVEPKGPLARAGIEAGDVILGVDDQEISGVEDLATVLDLLPHHKRIALVVLDRRTAQTGVVKVKIR